MIPNNLQEKLHEGLLVGALMVYERMRPVVVVEGIVHHTSVSGHKWKETASPHSHNCVPCDPCEVERSEMDQCGALLCYGFAVSVELQVVAVLLEVMGLVLGV